MMQSPAQEYAITAVLVTPTAAIISPSVFAAKKIFEIVGLISSNSRAPAASRLDRCTEH
jgi:hypothetical protein